MKHSVFLIAFLGGCTSAQMKPDEFHLGAGYNDWNISGHPADAEGYTVGGGFTWYLGKQDKTPASEPAPRNTTVQVGPDPELEPPAVTIPDSSPELASTPLADSIEETGRNFMTELVAAFVVLLLGGGGVYLKRRRAPRNPPEPS